MCTTKSHGFTLVELLLAIAAGMIVIGGSLYAFRAVANTAISTSKTARVTSKLELALNRIKADLEEKPTAILLPESNGTRAVAAYFTGPGVQAEPDPNFSTSTSVTVTAGSGPPVAPGDPAVLVNSAGQVLVIPAVGNVEVVDSDSVRIDHGACANGIAYTPSTTLYPAQLVYFATGADVPGGDPASVYRKEGRGPWEPIAYGLEEFNISYLYHDASGHIIHDPTYGAYTLAAPAPVTAPSGSPERTYRLYALDLYASASDGPVSREYNAQVRLNQNTGTALRSVTVCGGGSTTPSTPPTTGGVTGDLNVTIVGLPSDQPAAVDVSGPNGYAKRLLASALLRDLDTGNYTVVANDVWSDAYTAWGGSPASQAVTVASWTPANATVTYAKVPVDLTVSITGLPTGAAADVTASGPGGFHELLTASRTFRNLDPGPGYRVEAREVWSDALSLWRPTPTNQTFDLRSYDPYTARVQYDYVPCRLDVSVVGLPAGTDPDVVVTGPEGFTDRLQTTAKTYPSLRPGQYSATGNIVSDGTFDYEVASVDPDPAACKSGESASLTVTYAKLVGSIVTIVNGPPGDRPAPKVTLLHENGPDTYTYTTSGRHVEDEAPAGRYTVSVRTAEGKLTDQGVNYYAKYTGTPSTRAFTLRRGQTVTVTVDYDYVPGYLKVGAGPRTPYRPGALYVDLDESGGDGESETKTTISCSYVFSPSPGDTCSRLETKSFPHYSETYSPNHTYVPINSEETTTVQHAVSRTDIVTYTLDTWTLYYDNDGDGNVDGSCQTSYTENVYFRDPHPSHHLNDIGILEDYYLNCPPQ